MTGLPSFTADAQCPKCGSGDIALRYAAKVCWPFQECYRHPEAPHYGLDKPAPAWEHMHRHCRGCSYHWLEAPLDAAGGA